MPDIFHYWDGDAFPASNGDLMQVDGSERTRQRILRRLLTNPGDYQFHPTYGAGLPQWIGKTLDVPKITGLIRGQILMEAAVARSPEPQITVTQIAGGISCSIKYADASTGASSVLSFNVQA